MSTGTVSEWHKSEGWGVINSPDTPGGCFVHFTHIVNQTGFRELQAGEAVQFEWEAGSQDDYNFRALVVRRGGDHS
ncbi:cold shock domain-containing protein [Mycobacterium sp. DBP42]|nr:cold shock domain-containing protein [Mycobacterium sp. DBP42]